MHCSLGKRYLKYHGPDIGRLVLDQQIECLLDPKSWNNGQKRNFWPVFDWNVRKTNDLSGGGYTGTQLTRYLTDSKFYKVNFIKTEIFILFSIYK